MSQLANPGMHIEKNGQRKRRRRTKGIGIVPPKQLYHLEKLGDFESIESSGLEVTADQLKRPDPREKLSKFGVQSLKEFVERNQQKRQERTYTRRNTRELITARCMALLTVLERAPDSPRAQTFLREVATSGGWGYDFWRFLTWNPELRPRLESAWLEATRATKKVRVKSEKKEMEKARARRLQTRGSKAVETPPR